MAAAAIAIYLIVAVVRIGYPFELQWLEGGAVEHVRRILDGQPVYARPSLDFVAYPYSPLYPYLAAGLAWVTGVGFLPLRLVSLSASVATLAVLAVLGRRETGHWFPGLVAAGLYAAAFGVTGAWYDLARPDSLFLFLLVLAVSIARFASTPRMAALGGVVLALSFLAKQTALVAGVPLIVWLLLRRRRLGIAFTAGFGVPLVGTTILFGLLWGEWYRYFVFEALFQHRVHTPAIWGFPAHLVGRFGAALVVMAAGAVLARSDGPLGPRLARSDRPPSGDPAAGEPPAEFYAAVLVGLVAASWTGRLHSGGYVNALMPAAAAVAVVFALTLHRAGLWCDRRPGSDRAETSGPAAGKPWVRTALAGACLAQFGLLAWNPAAQVPTAADEAAGQRLIAILRAQPGDVLVVAHPYYGVLAGKGAHAQAAAMGDIFRGRDERLADHLRVETLEAVRTRRFAAIVVSGYWDERSLPTAALERYYMPVPDPVFAADDEFRPVTDIDVRPDQWYLRREPPTPGP